MSLTRKLLKGMGLTDEQVDTIIDAHRETVDGLKDQLETAQDGAKDLDGLRKQLEQAQADLAAAKKDGWEDKYNGVKKEFDEYKAGITAKETKAAKERAVRAYFEGKSITGDNLEIAMRGSGAEIDAVELDGDKIKDPSALDALVKGAFAKLVTATTVKGAQTATPPTNTGGGVVTKDQIFQIKDRAERRAAIAQNMNLFEAKGE